MRGLKHLCLSMLLLGLVACAKPVPPEKADYVGQWNAPNMSILITQEGRINYHRTDATNGKTVNKGIDGLIKAFHGDDFEVGVAPLTTTFVVSEIPHQVDGKWKMTVDGVELTKAN